MSDFGDSDMDMGLSATPAPGQGSRRGTPAPGSAADVPPAAKKQKRAVPRFLGDGLSDEEDGRVPQAGSSKGADATAALFDDLDNIFDDDQLPPAIDISAPVDNNATVHQADEDIDTALPETKKRAPRAKLDYERLLGPKGFPKLIEECRNFKLGAKGSEEQDLKRLMAMYQLWAHNMYPKTNLSDSINKIETVCHKRIMTNELRSWKMKAGEGQLPPDPSTVQDAPEDMPPNEDAAEDGHLNPLPEDSSAQNVATMVERGEDWEDDDLDAAINAATQQNPSQPSTSTASAPQPTADADFDDQDLLELDLAQFDADEEALADSAQMSASTSKAPSATKPTSATTSDRPAAEEEDFDFGMDEDILREMEEAEGLVSAHRQEANKDPTSHPT